MRREKFNGLQSLSSHATLMMTILKNNKRDKIRVYNRVKPYLNYSISKSLFLKKAIKQQLASIKQKTKK